MVSVLVSVSGLDARPLSEGSLKGGNKVNKLAETVRVVDVPNEGLISLLNQVVTLLCVNYFYTGTLSGVNDTCVLLKNPSIVYETGNWTAPAWSNAQKLPHDIYVMRNAIEAFGVMK